MAMDIKDLMDKIPELVEKISKDKSFQDQFQKDPVKAVEKVLGMDLPEDEINKVIDGIKAKLTADKLSGAASMLKKLF